MLIKELPNPIPWRTHDHFYYGLLLVFSDDKAKHNAFIQALDNNSPSVVTLLAKEVEAVLPDRVALADVLHSATHGRPRRVEELNREILAQAKRYCTLSALLLEACAIVAAIRDDELQRLHQTSRSPR